MASTSRKLFVNIRVRDLQRSMAFFGKLGFSFDPQFTDDNAACMIVGEDAYFMLLTDPMFRRFTQREPADVTKVTAALYALSTDSRAGVDAMVQTAVTSGGAHALPPQDHGFMYQSSFYDPDGHHFEVFWMDESKLGEQQA